MTTWLEHAESLPMGRSTRANCDAGCGEGKTLIINHNAQGYSCHCFRCPFKGFQGKGYQTLAQLAKIKAMDAIAVSEARTLAIPSNAITDSAEWPFEARQWLYEASIYGKLITDNGIVYVPSSGRVYMPVYINNILVFYQARRIYGDGPKYLGPSIDRSSLLYWTGRTERKRLCIVVEDILSAIRVGRHCTAVSLLGTKITTQQAAQLSQYDHVVTWLDPDRAGVEGALSVRRLLSLTSEVSNITTDLDPKLMSDRLIKETLKDYLCQTNSN